MATGRKPDREPWMGEPHDDGGRFRAALRRVFGDGENALSWALPVGRVWRTDLKIHVFFVVYIVAEMIFSLPKDGLGPVFRAWMLGAMVVLVVLHEFGHVLACRRVGGEADEVILWPLGGLALCATPHKWTAEMITAVGGPAVNLALFPVFGGALLALTGATGAVFYNPFDPGTAFALVELPPGEAGGVSAQPWWLLALWAFHHINLVLLAFNMLVPMFPMDAGRVLLAVLWRRMGYERAMGVTAMTGLVTAGALGVLGIVTNETMLLAIAIFGGLVCFQERRRMQFLGMGEASMGFGFEAPEDDERESARAREAREKAERKAEEHAVRVDAILEKIARDGMGSLSASERRTLKNASNQRRKDGT